MWEIKQYLKRNKEKILKSGFETKELAEAYKKEHYPSKSDVHVIETKEPIDFSTQVGKWLWLYSPKQKQMFPYGHIVKVKNQYIKVKTRADAVTPMELSSFGIPGIQKWIELGESELRDEGNYVIIKEYV